MPGKSDLIEKCLRLLALGYDKSIPTPDVKAVKESIEYLLASRLIQRDSADSSRILWLGA